MSAHSVEITNASWRETGNDGDISRDSCAYEQSLCWGNLFFFFSLLLSFSLSPVLGGQVFARMAALNSRFGKASRTIGPLEWLVRGDDEPILAGILLSYTLEQKEKELRVGFIPTIANGTSIRKSFEVRILRSVTPGQS